VPFRRGRLSIVPRRNRKSIAIMLLTALVKFVSLALLNVRPAHADWNDDYAHSGGPVDAKDPWGFLTRECTSLAAWRLIHRGES
jgi:hypothetical protein